MILRLLRLLRHPFLYALLVTLASLICGMFLLRKLFLLLRGTLQVKTLQLLVSCSY
jgi:hypothetical protein